MNTWPFIRSGAIAGAFSSFVFVAVHDWVISDIWFSLGVMLVAGALCGLCVGWTYAMMVAKPSAGSWLRYNGIYVVLFGLLGLASVVLFEPVTTFGAVVAANEPPTELIQRAMPMTVIFTLVMAGLIGWLYGKTVGHYAAILLTCVILVALLGLNVSAIGLVYVPGGSVAVVVEMFALIVLLNVVFVAAFLGLERKRFSQPAAAPAAA